MSPIGETETLLGVRMYLIRIESDRDFATLVWMSERGYDAGIYESASMVESEEDETGCPIAPIVLAIKEVDAWDINEQYEEDPYAFLSCNGSDSLAAALHGFLEEIV